MGGMRSINLFRPLFFLIAYLCLLSHTAADWLSPGDSITTWQTLRSANGEFVLGFFLLGNSNNRYVGIWYNKIKSPTQTIVWVANRDTPLTSPAGEFTFRTDGKLDVSDGIGNSLWQTNILTEPSHSVVELLDSGNLVLRKGSEILWQSFDHPTDTLLPGMKIGMQLGTPNEKILKSWKSREDPGSGSFSFGLDPQHKRKLFIWYNSETYWQSSLWNGLSFVGMYESGSYILQFSFANSPTENYLSYSSLYNNTRLVMDLSGQLQFFTWDDQKEQWWLLWSTERVQCAATCGANGSCNNRNTPICKCLPGFEPSSPEKWNSGNRSDGCKRITPLDCRGNNQFLKLSGLSISDPNRKSPTPKENLTEEGCKDSCYSSCSCSAWSYSKSTRNRGSMSRSKGDHKAVVDYGSSYDQTEFSDCWIWEGDLLDVTEEAEDGIDISLKLPPLELRKLCEHCGTNTVPPPLSAGIGCGDPAYSVRCNDTTGQLQFDVINGSYQISIINPETRSFIIQLQDENICSKGGSNISDIHLNSSLPFQISNNNTLLLHCLTPPKLASLNCASTLCYQYMEAATTTMSCNDLRNCCSQTIGNTSSRLLSLGIPSTGCDAYMSIVNINVSLPASTWQKGLEIVWDPPSEPLCDSRKDCGPNSMCLLEKSGAKTKKCICNKNFKWDSTSVMCIDFDQGNKHKKVTTLHKGVIIIITTAIVTGMAFLGTFIYSLWRLRVKKKARERMLKISFSQLGTSSPNATNLAEDGKKGLEIPFVEFEVILAATNNFSDSNKLGRGGFGPVYKGKLYGGREIAVKRLSKGSGQGLEEFKN